MYSLGGIIYKTKIAATTKIQEIIKFNDISIINKEHSDYIVLNDLICLHEYSDDKIGCGIDYFEIRVNALNHKLRSIFLIRLDGTEIIFSFHTCLGKKSNDLQTAMREAISPFTMEYKKNNNLICCLCKIEKLSYTEYHVDHMTLPFSTISKEFLKITKCKIPMTFDKEPKTHLSTFKNEDIELKHNWIAYHNSKVDYQILCNVCNIRKSNK
jgi:hypothetical protein